MSFLSIIKLIRAWSDKVGNARSCQQQIVVWSYQVWTSLTLRAGPRNHIVYFKYNWKALTPNFLYSNSIHLFVTEKR